MQSKFYLLWPNDFILFNFQSSRKVGHTKVLCLKEERFLLISFFSILVKVLKKSDIPRIVSKTFDDTKAAGVKKIRLRAARSSSGLSE